MSKQAPFHPIKKNIVDSHNLGHGVTGLNSYLAVQAVNKVQHYFSRNEIPGDKKFIFVKTEYRLEKVFLNEVFYIEGMKDYRRIHTTGKRIMTLQTFIDFEKEISSSLICRVHKSFMVSLDKIESIERDRIKIKNTLIPISDTYRQAFYERINHPAK